MGRKFFEAFESRDGFFKIGVMTALLNWLGTVDVDREKFTMLVINNSTSRYCFIIQVGNGSDTQDFKDNNFRFQEGRNH